MWIWGDEPNEIIIGNFLLLITSRLLQFLDAFGMLTYHD